MFPLYYEQTLMARLLFLHQLKCCLQALSFAKELAKHKLQIVQKEDGRQESRHRQQEHKMLFEEWEKIQINIRLLRQDIRDMNVDETIKTAMQQDIDGLVQRKNHLASKLGLK